MLISVTSCNVNAADSDQTTPLVMAALQGNAVICETLVSILTCLCLQGGRKGGDKHFRLKSTFTQLVFVYKKQLTFAI